MLVSDEPNARGYQTSFVNAVDCLPLRPPTDTYPHTTGKKDHSRVLKDIAGLTLSLVNILLCLGASFLETAERTSFLKADKISTTLQ